MTTIVTERRLSADYDNPWWTLPAEQRHELNAWMEAHGIPPTLTRSVEIDVIDCPMLRAEIFEHPYRVTDDGDDLVIHTVERAIRFDLPAWWAV